MSRSSAWPTRASFPGSGKTWPLTQTSMFANASFKKETSRKVDNLQWMFLKQRPFTWDPLDEKENPRTRTKTQWIKPNTFSYNHPPPHPTPMICNGFPQGLEGYFRDLGFDQSSVHDLEKCKISWQTGKGIRLLFGKRDPPKFGHGKWDYLNVCREILGSSSECKSTRWAFKWCLPSKQAINKNWPRLSSNNILQTDERTKAPLLQLDTRNELVVLAYQ